MKKWYYIHKNWCVLSFLLFGFFFLFVVNASAQETNLKTKVPDTHIVRVNSGTGGSVRLQGAVDLAGNEFVVKRLSQVTLIVDAEEGYQFESAWCEGQTMQAAGSRLTISSVYADCTVYVRFGKRTAQPNEPVKEPTNSHAEKQEELEKSAGIMIDAKGNPMPYQQNILQINKKEKTSVMVIRALPKQNAKGESLLDKNGNVIYDQRSLLLQASLIQTWKEQGCTQIWFVIKDMVLMLPLKNLKQASYQVTLTPLENQKKLSKTRQNLLRDFNWEGTLYYAKVVLTEEATTQDVTAQIKDLRIRMLDKTGLTKNEQKKRKLMLFPDVEKTEKEKVEKLDTTCLTDEEESVWLEEFLQMDTSLSVKEVNKIEEKICFFEAELSAAGVIALTY